MSRSIWKKPFSLSDSVPFFNQYPTVASMRSCLQNLTKSNQKHTEDFPNDPLTFLYQNRKKENAIEVWSRHFMVLPEHIGKDVKIYNGKNWVFRKVAEEMVGHKYGEFYFTKKKTIHKINKVKQITRKK